VALEATFRKVHRQLKKLQENLHALHLTVAEDKPLRGEAALVDQFEDSILDTMGLLDECLNASYAAQKAVEHPLDLDRARRALSTCQECFHRAERRFSDELVSYEKLRDLASVSEKRGREWASWASSVKHGLEQCQQPIDAASKALVACWQEIAERVGTTNMSVRATNIRQQVRAGATESRGLKKEGAHLKDGVFRS
jgi:hypothetical protein